MDADVLNEEGVSGDEFNSMEPEAGSSRADILGGTSSGGETNGEIGRASEILTRVELDLACFSEKLVNLSVLRMHVATREADFESFISEKDNMQVESMEKAAEFDLLSGILDSEVNELDKFMERLETYIFSSRETISSFKHLGETFFKMEEKLLDSKESLKQSRDQVSEIKMQAPHFHRFLSRLHGNENGKLYVVTHSILCLYFSIDGIKEPTVAYAFVHNLHVWLSSLPINVYNETKFQEVLLATRMKFDKLKEEVNYDLCVFAGDLVEKLEKTSDSHPEWRESLEDLSVVARRCAKMQACEYKKKALLRT